MAYYQTYTVAGRKSFVKRGDTLRGVGSWERPGSAGVDFTISDGVDDHLLLCVTLTDAELDRIVEARDRHRERALANKLSAEMGPGN